MGNIQQMTNMIFFLFILENRVRHVMQITPKDIICMKCQVLLSRKNKTKKKKNTKKQENYFKISSAEIYSQHAKY